MNTSFAELNDFEKVLDDITVDDILINETKLHIDFKELLQNDHELDDRTNVDDTLNDLHSVEIVREPNSPTLPPAQPKLRDLIKFALPCLDLWMSGPLLSLVVDTAFVDLTAKPGMAR